MNSEYEMYETQCEQCSNTMITDEWLGNAPYWGVRCECGGEPSDTWRISDEPHPAIWG
jgi:hypothetical protein